MSKKTPPKVEPKADASDAAPTEDNLEAAVNEQRAAVFAAVDAARLKELESEGITLAPATEEPKPQETKEAVPETLAAEGTVEKPEAEVKEVTATPPPTETLVEVTVDGEKRQVKLSELQASYQMDAAARNRLREAAETLRRAEDIEQQARARHAPPQTQTPDAGSGDRPATGEAIDFGGLIKSIQVDEPEIAAKKFQAVVESLKKQDSGKPNVTPEQIEERAVARAMAMVEWDSALSRFTVEYQDILNLGADVGGFLGFKARQAIEQDLRDSLRDRRARRPYWDILHEVGSGFKSTFGSIAKPQDSGAGNQPAVKPNGGAPVQISQTKLEQKRTAITPPAARSPQMPVASQKTPEPDEVIEQGRAAALADMMKARRAGIGAT